MIDIALKFRQSPTRQVLEPQDTMKPSASCVQPLRRAMVVPAPERSRLRVFAFVAAVGRLCSGVELPTGTWKLIGFSVTESPVGVPQRGAKGFEAERLLIDSACVPMHGSESIGIRSWLDLHWFSFAVPLRIHQKHLSNTGAVHE